MATERHEVAFVVGAILGGVAGATYGLFNAPQAGVRTRADLTARCNDVAEQVAQIIAELDTSLRQPLSGADAEPPARDPAGTEGTRVAEPAPTLPDPREPAPVNDAVGTAASSTDAVKQPAAEVAVQGPRTAENRG